MARRYTAVLCSVAFLTCLFMPVVSYAQAGGPALPQPAGTGPGAGALGGPPAAAPGLPVGAATLPPPLVPGQTIPPPVPPSPSASGVDASACMSAGTNYEIFIAVVDLLMVAIAAGLILFLAKRGTSTNLGRWLGTGLVFSGLGTALIGWNPATTDAFVECVSRPELVSFIPLGTLNPWIAGVVVGLVPIFVVHTLVVVVLNRANVL